MWWRLEPFLGVDTRRARRASMALLVAALLAPMPVSLRAQAQAKDIYESSCAACHAGGVLGAPRFGDAAQWAPRSRRGLDALVRSAVAGTAKGMPPKGGRADLSDAQVRSVVEYMLAAASPPKAQPQARDKASTPPPTAGERQAAAAPPPATQPAAAPASAAAPQAAAPSVTALATAARAAEVNAFNRLLKPAGRFNRPALESGIHDPTNDMTAQLQPPAAAFAELPKSLAGNHVDWVKALDAKAIAPRWDRQDAGAPAVVMDLNIVREVKGSMPDVVYPHKQHTEWLDCSNCHPAIFVPQKGANQISMAAILLGQKCGVCHGKVAFPVSECRLCHSKKKAAATVTAEPAR